MADVYEKDLGAKSSITASDFIRIVGSDNVSYKNTVSNVVQSLNLNIGEIGGNSQSAFETNLLTKLSAMNDGEIKMASVYPNYSSSFTSGARSPAVLYRYSSGIYKCEILTPKAWEGYYYSNAWHWSSEVDALKTISLISPSEVASDITNNLFIRKQNDVVAINGYITRTNAFTSTQTQVMILPTGSRPAFQVRASCALSGAAYNPPAAMGYLLIDSTGYMGITAPASNTSKVAYFSVSYIAQA